MVGNFLSRNKFVHWIRNFFFLPLRAMPRELSENYDMRRESYVGSLRGNYSKATSTEAHPNEGSKRTLKSLVDIFNIILFNSLHLSLLRNSRRSVYFYNSFEPLFCVFFYDF